MHAHAASHKERTLLKLKKLQILGFKSFCDRTELKFHGEGIAAIVGPNGCGKSNISDAISWVLGEQSAKSLRGARMEDVIFAGTRDRQPTGMAEVSLTLVDPEVYEGEVSSEPEIEIRDEMPEEDWNEEAVRAEAAAAAEQHYEEVRPLGAEEVGTADETTVQEIEAEPAEEQASVEQAPTDEPQGRDGAGVSAPGVVLKIRRRKLKRPEIKAGQIIVTRRLFRSGDSDYLLNGKLCRLRDIQEMFMGTGLGPESYAIIEQGRIGQILSSKPHDRRAIIEEAAGITKFKTKKRLSELRLEEARQNLARVNDIFEEVTRQMNSLKRQASKAERYAKLREEMKSKLKLVLTSKFAQVRGESANLEAELAGITEQMRTRAEAAQEWERQQAECTQRGYSLEAEARANSERLNQIGRDVDRASNQQRHNQERCAELTMRCEAGEVELARGAEQMASLESELATNRAVLGSAAEEVAAAQAEAALRKQEASVTAEALAELERQQEQRRVEILQAVAGSAEVRNQITQAVEHAAALDREAQRVEQEMAQTRGAIENCGGRRGQLQLEFESVSQRLSALGAQIEDTRQRLEARRREEGEAKRRLDGLRAEYATALGRKSSLEAVIAEHGYSTESVKRLFQSGVVEQGFHPAGVLADFLEVDSRYEAVVEDFLRDELNYVVVKSWDAADHGLRLLEGDVNGRATFLVHPEDSQAKFSFAVDENGRNTPPAHVPVLPLKNCIRVLNGFGKSLEVILPKLGNGYITPDPFLARELALENPDAFFLSKSGECFHNVTVTGGRQRAEGPLSMKRELREVLRQVEEIERALADGEQAVARLAREISELSSRLERLRGENREAEREAMTSGHALEQINAELTRAREREATCAAELERIRAARREKEEWVAARQEELGARERQREQLEGERSAAQARLEQLKGSRDAAAYSASEMAARLAALEERRTAAAAAVARIESLHAGEANRIAELQARMEAARGEIERRQQENVELAAQVVSLAAEREGVEVRAQELQAESEAVRVKLGEIDQALREIRAELDIARDRRGEISAAIAKLQSDVEYLQQTTINELGMTSELLLGDATVLRVEGEQLAAEDAMVVEMRGRLEAMGPVNMMALEEYQETTQRHVFLETQRKDLLDSIENMQNTIREIEVFSRQKFQEAFERINENFQLTFRKLFGGGHAFMRLTDEENSTESGIDVVASPPGKKLQNVLLLSGGEKALTALALLVGIFQYQPSPFCILDEVDAPLDETNIGRFTELVREMSVRTQFIIITHSKKTMSVAPVMYGVTMQEPGVSKLVSVTFGENQQAASA
jgi:chromosome segregation protein